MIPRSIRQKLLMYTLVPTVVIYGIAFFSIFSELSSETRRNVELHLSAVVRNNADSVDTRTFAPESLATEGDRSAIYTVSYQTGRSVWVAPYFDARTTGRLMVT